MDCEQVRDQFLSELVTGEGDRGPKPLRRHLEGCEGCRTELEELGRVWAALGQLPPTDPRPDVGIRVMRRVRRQILREAVLTIRGWVPAVLAAVAGVTLSLGLALLVPYSLLVSLCQQALLLSPDDAAPYLLAGLVYGMPLTLGAWLLRRRATGGTLIGGLEASVLFLLILAPFVIVECREFAPALRAAFVSGLGWGPSDPAWPRSGSRGACRPGSGTRSEFRFSMTTPAPRPSLKGSLLLGLAFLTCPCHLPILLALLAGTGLAGVVGQHFALAFGALAVLFVASLLLGFRALRLAQVHERGAHGPARDADPGADRSAVRTGDGRH